MIAAFIALLHCPSGASDVAAGCISRRSDLGFPVGLVTEALAGSLNESGAGSPQSIQSVSLRTLLPQMWNLGYLTRPPHPAFSMAQASSYDRASNPGPNQDWFANGDAGQFVRTETNDGRTEQVMADLKGPGAVVRVWSANPQNTIRFYFDGETKPRISEKMEDLLTGKVAPFVGPFAYKASEGVDLYFPLPYAKSLKVTAEGTRGLYYHVGFRTYAAGTAVETYDPSRIKDAEREIRTASDHLKRLQVEPRGGSTISKQSEVSPGDRTLFLESTKPGTITELKFRIAFPESTRASSPVWEDPYQPQNILRNLILEVEFDGEQSIECPIGDFFATAPGINPLRSVPFEVRMDGTLICHLPMPFRQGMRMWIENVGSIPVPGKLSAAIDSSPPAGDSYHLHSQWTDDYGSTRPKRDMEFLNVQGEGYWVGSNLHVSNPVPDWWGEGDEKVFVDGESFPSTFGTGTEDYYGYAWSSPQLFQRPYHAQTRVDGPGTLGHTNVHRWQLFDPIPYTKSLKFDMEMWHWADVKASYARSVYWYAKPGGTRPVAVDRSLLLPFRIDKPKPVEGAIEGENLVVAERHGGTLQVQEGFAQTSGGKQLWWTDVKPGDRLVLKVPVPDAGTYEVIGNFCHAHDYGIHKMRLNGVDIPSIDFFGTGIDWIKHDLGTFTLPKGDVLLEVTCVGNRPEAEPSRMLGLDYLLLQKK
jgi:D-arabinan exo alpha-(1,3)/(1,5)-arabinofuranosidase (non-reducing end)